ncbi:glycosyltransferase family 4 protein [Microbacterium sp. CFBP9034]|uniref:glycosyltransferase family 4 protein n=1 Tax=Microbacterium sp. CFBP9034 TaxID=3096540 RepID=UPI002A69D419|nr:glycosyltransferase family 4 protein [Microbacterium sp. CFBP9034]MDY0908837.1 glycosyltransferase family 4 protein [Microbacterium sp. CFBP9034]
MTTDAATTVYFLVPEGVDDPERVSGGNVFDRRLSNGLSRAGWEVRQVEVGVGSDAEARAALADVPTGGLVLIDGLVAGRAADAVEAGARRLRIVVLAHMVSASFDDPDPRAIDDEERVLRAARRVIVTSEWTRSELVDRRIVSPDRVSVASPGVDEVASVRAGTPAGGGMLCVGVVAPHKGQDLLVEALAGLVARPWHCTITGSLTADPVFADQVAARAADAGIADRITMTGVLTGDELDAEYRNADLLVAPSRVESYGMAIADALSRGIPVVATAVGGIPATVAPVQAALLVPPERAALRAALDSWLTDPALRARLTADARRAGAALPTWNDTIGRVSDALAGVP